jgi:hypothetical protein
MINRQIQAFLLTAMLLLSWVDSALAQRHPEWKIRV